MISADYLESVLFSLLSVKEHEDSGTAEKAKTLVSGYIDHLLRKEKLLDKSNERV